MSKAPVALIAMRFRGSVAATWADLSLQIFRSLLAGFSTKPLVTILGIWKMTHMGIIARVRSWNLFVWTMFFKVVGDVFSIDRKIPIENPIAIPKITILAVAFRPSRILSFE